MHFILSQDNEILLRADWIPMETLRAMVKAANDQLPANKRANDEHSGGTSAGVNGSANNL
jgi:hypothetical protein